MLQVPGHPFRDQADRRRPLRRHLVDSSGDRVGAARAGRVAERQRDAAGRGGLHRPQERRLRRRGRAHPRRHGPRHRLVHRASGAAAGWRNEARRAPAPQRDRDRPAAVLTSSSRIRATATTVLPTVPSSTSGVRAGGPVGSECSFTRVRSSTEPAVSSSSCSWLLGERNESGVPS
uniref:Uncharacterized protein n=1 Tax=Arundo donax TaxID=35708 RepID=A0A0A8Z5P0_ARUDO